MPKRILFVLSSTILAVALLGGVLVGATAASKSATPSFNVDSTLDEVDANPGDGVCLTAGGVCTLRAAVMESNALPGADTILIPAGQYDRTIDGVGENGAATGDLDVTDSLTILGADAGTTIIDASQMDRVFEITATTPVTVLIAEVTIQGGLLTFGSDGGGGMRVDVNGRLILSNTVIQNNDGRSMGGGVENFGGLIVYNSVISNNILSSPSGDGGGISTDGLGVTQLISSTIVGNSSRNGAGASIWFDAIMTVTDSVFIANIGTGLEVLGEAAVFDSELTNHLSHPSGFDVPIVNVENQGQIYMEGSTIGFGDEIGFYNEGISVISNSLIIDNSGAGIFNGEYLEVWNSTVVSNTGSGIYGGAGSGGGDTYVYSSLIRGNDTSEQLGTISSGGGIYNGSNNRLRVISSTIQGNLAIGGLGGGIYAKGPITVTGSLIEGNQAGMAGGGLYLADLGSTLNHPALLENSLIQNNQAGSTGGGIHSRWFRTLAISGSTFYNNSAGSNGGGLYLDKAVTVDNTTISQNTSNGKGGGLYQYEFGTDVVDLLNVTIYQNNASDGFDLSGIILSATNSIVAGMVGNNCEGTITSLGYNLDSGDSCGFNQSSDITNMNPLLGPLEDNGGPTLTHALLPGSPAIDGGSNLPCPAIDQRGFPRPIDGDGDGSTFCDIGALELEFSDFNLTKSAPAMAAAGDYITYTLTVVNNLAFSVTNVVLTDTIPNNAFYVSGGTQISSVVSWTVPELMGGMSFSRSFVVTATETITNNDYRVSAAGGFSTTSGVPVVTVVGVPISGLSAMNDSPTDSGSPTNFLATVTSGSGVSYIWGFGDGNGGSGPSPAHTYAQAGNYTAVVTASNVLGSVTATTLVTIEQNSWMIFTPAVFKVDN